MSNERRNISDRGSAGPQAIDVFRQWHEDRDRRERGELTDIDVGDVRSLTSESIAKLGETHGTMKVASAIQAAALKQLASIKLSLATLPDGERLVRVGDDGHLTPEDCDWLNTRKLQRAQAESTHRALHEEARLNLVQQILDAAGYERGEMFLRRVGNAGLERLLRIPKHLRRVALRDALEETTDE